MCGLSACVDSDSSLANGRQYVKGCEGNPGWNLVVCVEVYIVRGSGL